MKKMCSFYSSAATYVLVAFSVLVTSCSAPRQASLSEKGKLATNVSPVQEESFQAAQAAASSSFNQTTDEPDFLVSQEAQTVTPAAKRVSPTIQEQLANDPKAAAIVNELTDKLAKSKGNETHRKSASLPAKLLAKKLAKKAEKLKQASQFDEQGIKSQKAAKAVNSLVVTGIIIALIGVILLLLNVNTIISIVALAVGIVLLILGII